MIADFMTDVVRERIEDKRETLSYGDFDSFVMEKSVDHPELGSASEYTLYKTKQVLFRLMKESGFFLNKKLVVPVLLPAFVQHVAMNNPDNLLYLPAPADLLKGLAR